MAELIAEQHRILQLADKTGIIREGDRLVCPGIHFCNDWNGLPICADSPEASGCTCGRLSAEAG